MIGEDNYLVASALIGSMDTFAEGATRVNVSAGLRYALVLLTDSEARLPLLKAWLGD